MAKRVKKRIAEMTTGELRKLRYRDGYWLQARKRIYLYWFKFLQHAERDERFTVNWRKYRSWGGANEVLGSKFDDWWEAHWKELFGVKNEGDKARFSLSTTKIKADGVRWALLCYENRHRGSAIEISDAVRKRDRTGRAGYLEAFNENGDRQIRQSRISQYLREADKILANVCDGRFT